MKMTQPETIRFAVCMLAAIVFAGCGTQPPAMSSSDWYFDQFGPGEFESMSIEERLNVMADVCPDGTKPYCRVGSDRDRCSCIADDQMRRNLEAFIR